MTIDEVNLQCKNSGVFNECKSKFSKDEESVFVAKNKNICQYNKNTGLLVKEFQGLQNEIVNFDIFVSNSSENLIACSTVGEIIIWNTNTSSKIIEKKINCNVVKKFYLLVNSEEKQIQGIIASIKKNQIYLVHINILTGGFLKEFKLKLKGDTFLLGVSSEKRYMAVADKSFLHFISVDDPNKTNRTVLTNKKYQKDKYFTCLECHLNKEIVITGDSTGQVILWYNIFDENLPRSIYHWHTLPVNCLAFSSAGSYFYSGGNESVLVRWDWENTQDKKFLPRLPGFIKQIGISNQSQLIAVTTSDNAIKIIDSLFNNVSLIQCLVAGDNYDSGIILEPRTQSLIMNGAVGHIQFYQPKTDTLLYTIDIVGQNKLSSERNCKIENTKVSKFAISKNGIWLATVESRKDLNGTYQESRIKFWNYDESFNKFKMNTLIEKPHEGSISTIIFSDNETDLKCVTVGTDRKFRIWEKVITQKRNIDQIVWNCLSAGFYRDLPCQSGCFSVDGSLLAIGFGPLVTIWLPDLCQLKCSLVYPGHKNNIKHIEFGTSNQCHIIVAATNQRLSVWNLLTLTMLWTVVIDVDFLLTDKLSTYMTIITKNKDVIVFTPNSPKPLFSSNTILKETEKIVAAALIPTGFYHDVQSEWFDRMEIYIVDSKNRMFSIGTEDARKYVNDNDANIAENNLTLFKKIIPNKKIHNTSNVQKEHLFVNDTSQKTMKNYLESQIHTMVPIRLTCGQLIKSFIQQKNFV